MPSHRFHSLRRVSRVLISLGVLLLLLGIAAGWILPELGTPFAHALQLDAPIPTGQFDTSSYLGADITALAVIIAVLIGFNITGLQIAGQSLSLALVRAWLISLAPFLVCWSFTTTVALAYFIIPPTTMGQIWQVFLWFGAVVLLMVGYLWSLPWQLSGEYAAEWALGALKRRKIAQWESLDGFSVLQTGVASASGRGELVTVRVMTMEIGRFLAQVRDRDAERANEYDRRRYRALKNLLSGCAQNIDSPPNAKAYYVGYLTAGVLLQATAIGHSVGDAKLDLFSGLFRALRGERDRVDPLWTGMRHALCRKGAHGEPYLVRYWREHQSWGQDDPRVTQRLAEGLILLHAHCWRELRAAGERPAASVIPTGDLIIAPRAGRVVEDEVRGDDALLLMDLYRDLGDSLCGEIASAGAKAVRQGLHRLPLRLLDAVQHVAEENWFPRAASADQLAVKNEYQKHRAALVDLAGEDAPAEPVLAPTKGQSSPGADEA